MPEHPEKTHTETKPTYKGPNQLAALKPGPSCCEVTVIITEAPWQTTAQLAKLKLELLTPM